MPVQALQQQQQQQQQPGDTSKTPPAAADAASLAKQQPDPQQHDNNASVVAGTNNKRKRSSEDSDAELADEDDGDLLADTRDAEAAAAADGGGGSDGSGSSEEEEDADSSSEEEEEDEQQEHADGDDDVDDGNVVPPAAHPYGVQPWGNYYLSQQPEIRTAGLGVLACLSDDLILGSLLELLSAADLAALALTSKALYCFAHTNDLWKGLVLQELGGSFDWCGSWRETYLAHTAPGYKLGSHKPLQVSGFYSDYLHQPWFCATVPLQETWLEVDNIDRRTGLTPADFVTQYESRNRPVLLTDGASDWPALTKWSNDYLAAALAGRPVIVGNAAWRFGSYLSYCNNGAALDEMPLYMFDKAFASACPHLVGDYRVPSVFTEDLFEVLGEEGRPDYRWLIIGPHRSGSSFHVDPNATCAWNAVVSGAKKWILFPPGSPPPGVHPSPDGADVAAPVSIIEWFLNFYDEARHSKHPPIECICRPGEVLYVPRGWWHCVLNLGHTVAVTQNFVSSTGLPRVLEFLRPGRVELVSGCGVQDRASLHDRFVSALEQQRPHVLAALRQQQEQQRQQRMAEHRLSELFKKPISRSGVDDVVGELTNGGSGVAGGGDKGQKQQEEVASGAGFSFGFNLAGSGQDAARSARTAQEGSGDADAGGGGSFSFGFNL